MKKTINIAKAELKQLFYSPIGWMVLIIFFLHLASAYFGVFDGLVNHISYPGKRLSSGLSQDIFSGLGGIFWTIRDYLFIYIPLLTMGLLSKEYATGSIKLLYSSPITNRQIVFGKMLSMMGYALILTGLIGLFVIHGQLTVKDFDCLPIIIGLLSCYLLICTYAAIGIFISSLTSYQVIAAICSIALIGGLSSLSGVADEYEFMRDITWWISVNGRMATLAKGLVCSRDLIYFAVVPTMFLWLTIIKLNGDRTRASKMQTILKSTVLVVAVGFIGYFASQPSMISYWDATRNKSNTLAPKAQEILKRLDGDLSITYYVNVLGNNRLGYNYDHRRYEKLVRFKPEIKFKTVHYYDTLPGHEIYNRYPGKSGKEIMQEIVRINRTVKEKNVLSPEEIHAIVDLSDEPMPSIRVAKRENGDFAFIRDFNDFIKAPLTPEYIASLYTLAHESPEITFVKGHRERGYDQEGDRGFYLLTINKTYRFAMINQGFSYKDCNIGDDVFKKASTLVIADPISEFSEEELESIMGYIENGGDLVVMTDVGHSKYVDPIAQKLGLNFIEGQLAHTEDEFADNLVQCMVPREYGHLAPTYWAELFGEYRMVPLNGTLGIDYSNADNSFEAIPIMQSISDAVWNEKTTEDPENVAVNYDPNAGEVKGRYTTGVSLSREKNGKQQQVVFFGDTDFMSNVEMTKKRSGINSKNSDMIYGLFSYLNEGALPVDMRIESISDNDLYIRKPGLKVSKYIFFGIIPLILLFTFLVIWMRRKSQ